MTDIFATEKKAIGGIRAALAIGGVLAAVVGLVILFWPGKSAVVVTGIIAVYAVLAGLVYVVTAAFSRSLGSGWSRVGYVLLGVLFVIAGISAFTNLSLTAATLAVFLGVLVGVLWIVEGIVALSTLSDQASKGWAVVFGIISVIAGLTLLFSPFWGAAALWWLIGIGLVVLGVFGVIRAVTFGRGD